MSTIEYHLFTGELEAWLFVKAVHFFVLWMSIEHLSWWTQLYNRMTQLQLTVHGVQKQTATTAHCTRCAETIVIHKIETPLYFLQ